ncbi:NAD(P)/FAD-dependent oxidoreductase [Rubrobacter aplysinae]|uniref:NAD(P)/FAD-dependent oxidoreductase n=1 Tax=Rubrobacter aplysinae TaxID=909625 RepID=UPI00064BC716|nr:NAD(P)/FAD-dependent oxidoreductase [Rubrobacter aplysinae]
MNRILKWGLAIGGGALTVESLRWAFSVTNGPSQRYEAWEKAPYREFPNKVLIVGGGFGGFTAAKKASDLTKGRDDVGVMVISRENFFTFWPMLAGAIAGGTETKNVAQPIRRGLISSGVSFRRAEMESIDHENKLVNVSGTVTGREQQIPYDHLILAMGGEPAYFGIPGVEEHCISMTGIGTAEEIRNRVIERYEQTILMRGEVPQSALTFVVIGGGATGTETAAELHSLVHDVLPPDYPNIDPDRVKIILVDSNEQILKELDPALRRAARKRLDGMQIQVINNVRAEEVTGGKVSLDDGQEIAAENVIWTAGARASLKLEDLGELPSDARKGLAVDAYCRVEGYENIWGIGDCAANINGEGEPIPPNAQAATQGGELVAKNVVAAIDGEELETFEYQALGQLVELGSQFAVNDVLGIKFSGFAASLFWRATYLYKLPIGQNRIRIAADWMLDVFFKPAATQIRDREL